MDFAFQNHQSKKRDAEMHRMVGRLGRECGQLKAPKALKLAEPLEALKACSIADGRPIAVRSSS